MIRVFPRRTKWTPTDALAFIGDPPLFRPPEQPVRVSCAFTWDKLEALRLARSWGRFYGDVKLGGPAFGDPGGEFVPGRFIREGVTITSRGCPNRCPWCLVPRREGSIRELPIRGGWIVQDNNLLACTREHQGAVFKMLARQPHPIEFKGGLEPARLTPWHVERLLDLRLGEIWLACDSPAALPALEHAADLLHRLGPRKKRCFVLIGFGRESLEQASARLRRIFDLGMWPFAQLYQPEARRVYPPAWRDLARFWSRPAVFKTALQGREAT